MQKGKKSKKKKKRKKNKERRKKSSQEIKKEKKEREGNGSVSVRGEREKMKDFLVLRRSKLDSLSTKVGARSAIYVWTLKTWSFDKFHKVENFPILFIFGLKVI